MILAILAVLAGVTILAFAADQFVIGAARCALIRHVPSLVVGVVIIGFGTSAPELIVSSIAAFRGNAEVGIGNIVGSNIANLTLLLGLGAAMVPLTVSSLTVKREAPLVVAAVGLFALAVQGGGISRIEGALLLVAMCIALFAVTRRSVDDPIASDVVQLADAAVHRLGTEVTRTLLGLVATVGAAQLLLWGALDIADRAGLSQGFVGATMVAVGTSLPELVTVVQSARRGETDLIVGNLLGSNLFNSFGVGGVVGLISTPAIDAPNLTVVAAIAAIVAAVLALGAMMTGHTVTRNEGLALVVGYVLFVPFLA